MPGGTWVGEHKSTGKPPDEDRFYAGISLDPQTALYFDAARIEGLDPAGVLYDVVRRPDFHDPKPPPALKRCPTCKGKDIECATCEGSRKVPKAARTEECEACGGEGRFFDELTLENGPCPACHGEGRITKQVAYSNPRFGESAAAYEERIFELATTRRGDWFHRRELKITDRQIAEVRSDFRDAAIEVRWRERVGAYPRVGDRYVCAAPGRVCPWLDVCEGRVEEGSEEFERLYPLKIRGDGRKEER